MLHRDNSKLFPDKLIQKIENNLAPEKSYFLDLGCGTGRDSLFMLKRGFKVTAVDKSTEKIKTIKDFLKSLTIKHK